jgi:hypothetical protein
MELLRVLIDEDRSLLFDFSFELEQAPEDPSQFLCVLVKEHGRSEIEELDPVCPVLTKYSETMVLYGHCRPWVSVKAFQFPGLVFDVKFLIVFRKFIPFACVHGEPSYFVGFSDGSKDQFCLS